MKALETKNNNILIPHFHKVGDSFVGIKIKNDRIDFFYPETYNFDESSIENSRRDIISILQSISIAKTHSVSKNKIASSYSNNGTIPVLSYLWIIRDYLINGFYVNREKVFKTNQRGKVDWKKTINGQPIISNGNVIYKDIVVSIKNNTDDLIVEIHKCCVKRSIDALGWLFGLNNSSFIQTRKFSHELKNLYINTLKKELSSTFEDLKKERLKHMLTIIEGLDENENSNEIVYGVDKYAYVFERMIDSIFGNKDASEFYPSARWYLKNGESKQTSNLRPDTILVKDNIAYILDSKLYRYGYTANIDDLPETSSIQKQITYGDFIKNKKNGEINEIRNAFIIPYNKYNNKLGLNGTIEYIGYSETDFRDGTEKYEKVYAFLIDLKYVVDTWNINNHGVDIEDLVRQIEEIQQSTTLD